VGRNILRTAKMLGEPDVRLGTLPLPAITSQLP